MSTLSIKFKEQLGRFQKLPLPQKIALSEVRITQFYERMSGKVYVAFSGGKDSTVLLHLVRGLYPEVSAVFSDTGLEFPEIREFVKGTENVVWVRPKITFKQVIERYGYPVISKEQSQYISEYRNTNSDKLRMIRWNGNESGNGKISEKWKFLIDAPFQISDRCCYHLKKAPSIKYERLTGRYPYLGNTVFESIKRKQEYLRFGCNSFGTKRKISRPLSFWLEDDIWQYLKEQDVPYSSIYDKGYTRTGCTFCLFGVHLENPHKFQLMKKTHPRLFDYCMVNLGCGRVLDYIGVKY